MKYSDEELIEELHRVSEEYCDGETPTQKDIDNFAKSSSTPYKRFGSWNDALIEAGYEINNERTKKTKEELLSKIKEFSELTNTQSPRKLDFLEWVDFSSGVLVRFGGWNNLLREGGFRLNSCRKASEDELLKEIRYISQNYAEGKTPSTSQMDEHGQFSSYIYKKEFGGWNHALEKAGYKPRYYPDLTKEDGLMEIKRLEDELGRVPTVEDLTKYCKVGWGFFNDHFGSYNEAVKEAGFEPNKPPSGEDHPSWVGGYGEYYGPSWYSQKKEAMERDDYSCRVTGKTKEELGIDLQVHHINPVHNWNVDEEHEKMNSLDNLICLSRGVHNSVEGKWRELSPAEFEKKTREYLDSDSEGKRKSVFDY